MPEKDALSRLVEHTVPGSAFRLRVKQRIESRITPAALASLARRTHFGPHFSQSVWQRVRQRIRPPAIADALSKLARGVSLPAVATMTMKEHVGSRLQTVRATFVHRTLKWTAAFAIFLLLIQSLPRVLLAPTLKADTAVELIPAGTVTMEIAGVQVPVSAPQVLRGSTLIRTDETEATIALHNDGVIRLAPHTTVRIHDVLARRQSRDSYPTATLLKGKIWVLGLVPPIFANLSVSTGQGTVHLTSGSVSVSRTADGATVQVFDRGATVRLDRLRKEALLVAGEKTTLAARQMSPVVRAMQKAEFSLPWVKRNLDADAGYRREVLVSQQAQRERRAGILPTSFLYPAKRIAEQLDIVLTLDPEAKSQKLVDQADTRLSEALALLKDGQSEQAEGSLDEYKQNLIALAGSGDNLVKFLIKEQIASATSTVSVVTPFSPLYALKEAVLSVGSTLPDADLGPKDIEGYVLVDKLATLNQTLSATQNLTGAIALYTDLEPYLQTLLSEEGGSHPLLRREAKSLLVATSALLRELGKEDKSAGLDWVEGDIAQYLPAEPEKVLVSEEARMARVKAIVSRIFTYRYNRIAPLEYELHELAGDPDRPAILRRLYHELPEENSLRPYVATEMRELGSELRS